MWKPLIVNVLRPSCKTGFGLKFVKMSRADFGPAQEIFRNRNKEHFCPLLPLK